VDRLALWTLFSSVSGGAGMPYNDVIGRTIPSDRRSRLLAIRTVAGGTPSDPVTITPFPAR
jgi:hypothetical protein